jgi:hypothetical protein
MFSHKSKAQDFVSAEVLNSKTSEPVFYATIRFMDSSKGLIADYNGQFRIPIDILNTISFIEISSIGYENKKVSITNLKRHGINQILLDPQIEMLDAVVLKPKTKNRRGIKAVKSSKNFSAFEIVRKAVDAIKFNLSSRPHSYIGYYRDYQIDEIGAYYNLNEAIIEQFDGGIYKNILTHAENQAAIYSYDLNKNFEIDTLLSQKYDNNRSFRKREKFIPDADIVNFGGNELSILNAHNPIKLYNMQTFSFVNEMNSDFFSNHTFEKDKIFFNYGDPILFINFETHTNASKSPSKSFSYNINQTVSDESIFGIYSAIGTLKISLIDYSIYSFSYKIFERNEKEPLANVEIEYQRIDKTMYLKYLSFNNKFKIKDDDVFKERSIIYNKDQKNFEITFNSVINKETIKKRNFKILFKNKRLGIEGIEILNKDKIRIYLENKRRYKLDYISKVKDLKIEIKNVEDLNERKIYVHYNNVAFQFREFFIQEVFPNKELDDNLQYIDKMKPIGKSVINTNGSFGKYIINSPLMNRKL